MRQKTKQVILASIAIFAMVAMTTSVVAGPRDREMPAETDPFWNFFEVMSKPDDTAACLARVTELSQDPNSGVDEHYSEFCTDIANMPTQMQSDMASEGASTNLFDASNWHSISGLYFQKTENGQLMGRISFSNTVDFLTYRFFTFMNNFGNMVTFEDGYISLNSAMVGDMAHYGATLTMYNLNEFTQQPDIYVGTGTSMKKAVEGEDFSDLVWNDAENSLSFTPAHFSSFKAVAKGSKVKKMKISSVKKKSIKYKANKNSFKITVRGKNLRQGNTGSDCTLGFKQAQKIYTSKNGRHLKCTFRMSDFSVTGYYPLTVTIPGAGEVTRTNAVKIR